LSDRGSVAQFVWQGDTIAWGWHGEELRRLGWEQA